MSKRWDDYFLGLCLVNTTMSKDPNTCVGALVVGPDNEPRASGFNGFPRGIKDTKERLEDRDVKNKLMVHAERNCICNAARVGVSLKGCTLYLACTDDTGDIWGGPPCTACTIEIIQTGIERVVSRPTRIRPSKWHRHRTWSYNELSARYKELPEEFYLPKPEHIGTQSVNNKQGRDGISGTNGVEDTLTALRTVELDLVRETNENAFRVYRLLLSNGWPRELARSVLPVSTYSHMFATVDLLNLLKFLTLRCDKHAQYEIRVYADAMRDLARLVAPVSVGAWESTFNVSAK